MKKIIPILVVVLLVSSCKVSTDGWRYQSNNPVENYLLSRNWILRNYNYENFYNKDTLHLYRKILKLEDTDKFTFMEFDKKNFSVYNQIDSTKLASTKGGWQINKEKSYQVTLSFNDDRCATTESLGIYGLIVKYNLVDKTDSSFTLIRVKEKK